MLIDDFHAQVMEALAAGDRARLAELRGQAARLRNVVDAADGGAGNLMALGGDLRRIARTIEIGWTWQAMQSTRQGPPTPRQFTVREQVLAALREEALRPRDLAARLELDRTQVSRALRELKHAGKVEVTAPPAGADDHRAAVWRAARSDGTESRVRPSGLRIAEPKPEGRSRR